MSIIFYILNDLQNKKRVPLFAVHVLFTYSYYPKYFVSEYELNVLIKIYFVT
jgi:hypothetical protein